MENALEKMGMEEGDRWRVWEDGGGRGRGYYSRGGKAVMSLRYNLDEKYTQPIHCPRQGLSKFLPGEI